MLLRLGLGVTGIIQSMLVTLSFHVVVRMIVSFQNGWNMSRGKLFFCVDCLTIIWQAIIRTRLWLQIMIIIPHWKQYMYPTAHTMLYLIKWKVILRMQWECCHRVMKEVNGQVVVLLVGLQQVIMPVRWWYVTSLLRLSLCWRILLVRNMVLTGWWLITVIISVKVQLMKTMTKVFLKYNSWTTVHKELMTSGLR